MTLSLVKLKSYPILQQLQLEEALLRTDARSFCLINEGSNPAIVMGISSKPEEVIFLEKARAKNIPIIRRYSGGGCVIVDENTLFVTFILSKKIVSFSSYPENILRWSEEFYQKAFQHAQFSLKENDYVLKNRKCGGNAQYITKDRFVHHTSFLWDFKVENMQLLKHPPKMPLYRQNRPHEQFITAMKEDFINIHSLIKGMKAELQNRFVVEEIELKDLLPLQHNPHRISVCTL